MNGQRALTMQAAIPRFSHGTSSTRTAGRRRGGRNVRPAAGDGRRTERAGARGPAPGRRKLCRDRRAGRFTSADAASITETLSPATIRNIMADLQDLGLLYAPHTSAGRLPTEAGLRLFVNGLLEVGNISEKERESIEAQLRRRRPQHERSARAGDQPAVRPVALRQRRHGAQDRAAAEAHRVRQSRPGPGAGRHRDPVGPGREPADRHAGRHAGFGAPARRATISMPG